MARWEVVSDTERQDLGADGNFIKVRDITFQMMDSGRRGVVTVPVRNYTVEFVTAEINQYADRIDGITGLTG